MNYYTKRFLFFVCFLFSLTSVVIWAAVPDVKGDKYSLIIDGHRVCMVMGEIHYLRIPVCGCARLYADCRLVANHFNYGRPILFGLWRLPVGYRELELRILSIQQNQSVYFPQETDVTIGEWVKQVMITNVRL